MNAELAAKPNLFLVGAMKCGTTSLYEYLSGHPQVFFPHGDSKNYFRVKEPHYFAPDRHLPERVSIKSLEEYLALYRGSEAYRYRGDASASYLFSHDAPRLIKDFCGDARILIMLRPPVEMMHSKHRHLRRLFEDIPDFYEAVAASDDRRHGRRIPPGCDEDTWLDYIMPCQFTPQVEAYQQIFGHDAVKVILLEDFVSRPKQTWLKVVEFLDINRTYLPDFTVHNETRRRGVLERIASAVYSQPAINKVAHRIIPRQFSRRALSAIRAIDHHKEYDVKREQALYDLCRPDVERLSVLLGRDLSHWTHPSRNA